ncbi:MAG: cbb3-type cytochrome c oxidase subunit 3 [Gammaproteobacteria bacterium]|jgi:cytochrome c oxidase cbb3-type subunit IV|nr:cbb3-type cytochrome c oxidase subunit 3 [Gammaproteobacteria bacterium]
MSIILSAWTVVVFVMFIGITIWAWSGKNKKNFEDAAQIPFDDDDEIAKDSEELNNG